MKIFVVDDERIIRVTLADELRDAGHQVQEFANGAAAMAQIRDLEPDLIITDLSMPGMDGIEFLNKIKTYNQEIQVMMMTAYSTVDNAVKAMKLGAYDYFTKPFETEEMLMAIKRVEEFINVKNENKFLRKQIIPKYNFDAFVGQSNAVQDVFKLVKVVANSNSTVLITGETGTGKELLTNIIHFNSERKSRPFIKVSCAILNKEIFESELFGHVKGAYTGADKSQKGRFELAHTGTLYLDDIDDMPLNLQVKLLRALEEREIERVGGSEPIKVDIRVIASTKVDLKELVAQGKFREDLYYRLSVFPIHIPPLRERRGDLKGLIIHFIDQFSGKNEVDINSEALDYLCNYPFPGNTREVKNLIERLVLLAGEGTITPEIIPADIKFGNTNMLCTSMENRNLNEIIMEVEQNAIQKALHKTGGNKSRAAALLGIPASTLKSKIPKLFNNGNGIK